jgi:glycosyltransferase involved in cell wall biosynthesis
MRWVIGILAWNEAASIGATIKSLGAQTLFAKAAAMATQVEVVIVPNACTDATASVAEAALAKHIRQHVSASARVESLVEAGKSNAWNELIHRIAPADTDFYFLMDADILLLGEQTLENMLQALMENRHAAIATDTPVKHIAKKAKLNFTERILMAAGSMTQSAPGQLTGQLYCARGEVLRSIVIPKGLIVDDGFIKQMVCTHGFSQPADSSLIVRAANAAHLFECYTRLRDICNHQIRQAVGHTLYTYFTAYLREAMPERPIFDALKQRCQAQPDWFIQHARTAIRQRGFWVMDRSSFWVRWRRARAAKGMRKLRYFALAAVATPFDAAIFIVSNQRLKTGRVSSIWKDTHTSTLE